MFTYWHRAPNFHINDTVDKTPQIAHFLLTEQSYHLTCFATETVYKSSKLTTYSPKEIRRVMEENEIYMKVTTIPLKSISILACGQSGNLKRGTLTQTCSCFGKRAQKGLTHLSFAKGT